MANKYPQITYNDLYSYTDNLSKEKRRAIIDDTTPKNSNFALSSEGDAGNFCSPQEG